MRMTQKKILQFVTAKYGGDIANELLTRSKMTIPSQELSTEIEARHKAKKTLVRTQENNMLKAVRAKQ